MDYQQEVASLSLLSSKPFGSRRAITTSTIVFVLSLGVVFFEVLPMTSTSSAATTTTAIKRTAAISSSTLMAKIMKESKAHFRVALYGCKKDTECIMIAVFSLQTSSSDRNKGYTFAADRRSSSTYRDGKKFVHSSIRIEEDVLNALQKEAQRREVSFNNLVNKTLKNYVTSEMYFEQLGFILVSKDFLRKTFLKLDERYVEEFGREIGLTVAKEYISYFSGQVNSNTLVQFLDIWFKRFQFYQHRVEDIAGNNTSGSSIASLDNQIKKQEEQQQPIQQHIHSFTVIHDINTNFSLVLKSILEGLVEPITKSPIISRDITSTSITFSIKI